MVETRDIYGGELRAEACKYIAWAFDINSCCRRITDCSADSDEKEKRMRKLLESAYMDGVVEEKRRQAP